MPLLLIASLCIVAGTVTSVDALGVLGAGMFAVLAPLIVADAVRGTGRYNLALGAVATMQTIGASVSSFVAGEIVDRAGYSTAFVSVAAVASLPVLLIQFAMPETRPTSGSPTPPV